MSAFSLSAAHRAVLDASRDIGSVHDMAAWASDDVTRRIMATGKGVDDLTVGELRRLIADFRDEIRETS